MGTFAAILISAALLLGLSKSCDSDNDDDQSSSTPPPTSTVNEVLDYEDLSVNGASATVQTLPSGTKVIELLTAAGGFPAGGFNGGGTGSKAILNIDNFNDQPLSALTTFSWTAKSATAAPIAQFFHFNMIADMRCDGTFIKIITQIPDSGTPQTAPDAEGFITFTISPNDNVFQAVNALYDVTACDLNADNDCDDVGLGESSAPLILGDNNSPDYGSINSVLAAYPDACLVKVATGDGGMPSGNVPTGGLLLITGSSSTLTAEGSHIKEIKINDKIYEF